MKLFIYISALVLFPWISFSQGDISYLVEERADDSIPKRTVKTHSSFKPLIRQNNFNDSNKVKVVGLADVNYFQSEYTGYRAGLGVGVEGSFKNKWYFRVNGVGGIYKDLNQMTTKAYYREHLSDGSVYSDIRGRVSYTPNSIFNFQVGLDNNFVGEGQRSVILSDYGTPYPFAQIRMNFWRIEYTLMYQFMRERRDDQWKPKSSATHHISFNAAKWLNFGFFETVIFQPKDTLNNRIFDVEYLNPFVFYRPQEYAVGSSDNVLIGFEMNAFYKGHTFYSQMMLDEFSLKEVTNKTRWWATKFGAQLGVKGRFKIGEHKLFYRGEFNLVRPYTYAHISSSLNYGNQNTTLAHPYESNFTEALIEVKWNYKKFGASLFANYFLRGLDKDGFNYGNDLYTPYINRPFEYGHTIGQGKGFNGTKAIVSVNYQVLKHGNMMAFIENHFDYTTLDNKLRYSIAIGVRSTLWNDYRNY